MYGPMYGPSPVRKVAALMADIRLRSCIRPVCGELLICVEKSVIRHTPVRRKAQRPSQKSDTRDALELCEGLRRGFYRSIVHVPSPAISNLRTTLSRRCHFIRIQTAEVNAVKRLLRGVGRNSGRRGSLRTDAHWESLLAGDLVPEQLQETCAITMPYGARPPSKSARWT